MTECGVGVGDVMRRVKPPFREMGQLGAPVGGRRGRQADLAERKGGQEGRRGRSDLGNGEKGATGGTRRSKRQRDGREEFETEALRNWLQMTAFTRAVAGDDGRYAVSRGRSCW